MNNSRTKILNVSLSGRYYSIVNSMESISTFLTFTPSGFAVLRVIIRLKSYGNYTHTQKIL